MRIKMNFARFLEQDLSVIKKELNIDILKQKDKTRVSLLYVTLKYNRSLKKLKYILKFCILNCKTLFLEKFPYHSENTILHEIPTLYKPLTTSKYILKFFILNFPFIFLEKTNRGHTLNDINLPYINSAMFTYDASAHYTYKFHIYNFPELSYRTNIFILPLLIEMQN